MRALRALLVAGAATLAFPGVSLAETGPVNGTVGSELSIAVPSLNISSLTHAGPNTASGSVVVTSTGNWSLQAVDASETATKGKLVRQTGTGPADLNNLLGFSLGNVSGDLASGVITSGSLSATVPVDVSESVDPGELIEEGASYGLTVTYTATSVE